MVELCRVDIATKISLLSSHLAYPHEGHLEAALHAMGYKFKRGFATGCFGHRVFLVTHDAVKYSNGH